jgi:hypothetical protein
VGAENRVTACDLRAVAARRRVPDGYRYQVRHLRDRLAALIHDISRSHDVPRVAVIHTRNPVRRFARHTDDTRHSQRSTPATTPPTLLTR